MGAGSLALLATLSLVLPAMASACVEDGGGEDNAPSIGAGADNPGDLHLRRRDRGGQRRSRRRLRHPQVHGEVGTEGLSCNLQLIPDEVGSSSTRPSTTANPSCHRTTRNRRSPTAQ